ncbi:ATP-grasp domain-containing protein [Leuconostoc citreum]|uniref:ATP-grasp domain-containing protein n=1 Tax=Leuconostoc citreum TaxID=33964 RepID=UPI00209D6CEF|nr:hypothetical protein [Leuconostoc citreum]MCP1275765.1 hypothetical protein [Leuconostoc citreum]
MNIIVFRHPALENYLPKENLDQITIITPAKFEETYKIFYSEYSIKPKIYFLEDWRLPAMITVLNEINLTYKIEKISTLAEEDIEEVALLREFYTKQSSQLLTDLLFRDKYYMRSFLQNIVRQPKFRLIEKNEDIELFKKQSSSDEFILKRRNLAGGSHVKKVHRNSEITPEITFLDLYSGDYLIEEFVDLPQMVTADGYAVSGNISRFFSHEYNEHLLESFEHEYLLLRTSHLYHSKNDYINKIKKQSQKVLNIFLRNKDNISPFHFEWFINEETEEVVFNEVGRRFGGGNIPQLIQIAFGIDILNEYWLHENSIDNSNCTVIPKNIPDQIAASFMPYKKHGKIIELPSNDLFDWTVKTRMLSKIGDTNTQDVEIVTDIPFMSSFSASDETDLNIKIKRLIQLSNKIKYAKLDGDKDNMINDTVTN